jgi:hypothetical protein
MSNYPSAFGPPTEEAHRRQAAAMRSYVTPAVITLALYFVFWLPGLISNVVYLVAANSDSRISGTVPQGRGCLLALLIVFLCVPFGACLLFGGAGFLQALITGTPRH